MVYMGQLAVYSMSATRWGSGAFWGNVRIQWITIGCYLGFIIVGLGVCGGWHGVNCGCIREHGGWNGVPCGWEGSMEDGMGWM